MDLAKDAQPIYLDYNATTPVDPRVREAMEPYLRQHFGNPSSAHAYGARARQAVDRARQQVAALIGCAAQEVVFTSGGSEANNLAIKGLAHARRRRGAHIVTSAVEHPAVLAVCRHLEAGGCRLTVLPVDGYGRVDPRAAEAALTPRTLLVTVMHSNNEVGTLQPVAEIARAARRHGVPVHSDCAQSLGKVPVRVDELGVDLLSIAGHKAYAPKGVGALYVRSGLALEPLIHGAGHEGGLRAGTENVSQIVGLGEACAMLGEGLAEHALHMRAMRDRLEAGLTARFPDARFHGHPDGRLPNTVSVGFRGLAAHEVLSALTEVAASAGAACHGDDVRVSSVLSAMAVPTELARGTLRLSVGRYTTVDEIDRALAALEAVVRRLDPRSNGEAGGGGSPW